MEATYRTVRRRVSSIKPSEENLSLYKPVSEDDAEIIKLAESIRDNGLHEPLILTADGYLVSGHRRLTALKRIRQVIAPCRVLSVRWQDLDADERIALLRDHNRQRDKSIAEKVREEMVDINAIAAHEELVELRDNSIWATRYNGVPTLKIEGTKTRHGISDQKADHVKYITKIVMEDRRAYWPLSVRGTHYPLLNYSFYRNIPRKLKYCNDDDSYQATSDLITRMRLNGTLPWEAFDDVTRPIKTFRPFDNVQEFVRQQSDDLFCGYWRDLLQTQPNHIEVLCEKNTIYHMTLRVTEKYQLPTSSGRGFNSIDPWHNLAERYRDSGKQRLIVIVLSDFDPEGEQIPQVGGRTLRDDFGVEDLTIIKAGVTREQITKHKLAPMNFAKETSSNYDWFSRRNKGDDTVYELEALEPEVMLGDLETIIQNTLDMNLFNREAAEEQEEAAYLQAARRTAREALKGLLE